jgi:spore coat polysaccharide biosynthesis protein SpsF (cytidylyltransferase family)
MSANWKLVKDDLDWSLNTGEDVKGRAELKEAFNKNDAKYVSSAIEAYKMGQRDNHKLSNISRCAQEDDKRLYNMGRKLIGLKAL